MLSPTYTYTLLTKVYGPTGIAVDSVGNVYFTHSWERGDWVLKFAIFERSVTAVAGTGMSFGYTGDNGPATAATLFRPMGVALDSTGNIYIADTGNNVIRKVTKSTGRITTVAVSLPQCE